MAWANWEATAATVAANAATAKHFDTNVGSPRWQQVERGQEGGVVGAQISLAQATAKMPTHRQKRGVGRRGPTWQANYKCNHEINLINPGTKNAEQMFVETALRH